MPDTSNLTTPVQGMNNDLHQMNLDDKSYSYALNAVVEDFTGNGYNLANKQSNHLAINLPKGFYVIGKKLIVEQNRVLLFLVNPTTNQSQIAEYGNCDFEDVTDSPSQEPCIGCNIPSAKENAPLEQIIQKPYCTLHIITEDSCLNFNIDHPVDIEYKVTDCSLNIYFTDNYNERRYLYFDYLSDDPTDLLKVQQHFYKIIGYYSDDCAQPYYSNSLDCNKLKYHPAYEKPCIGFIDLVSGGNLKSGVYQVLIAYANVNGEPLTTYTPATQTIPIYTKEITILTDYPTDRAISLSIDNLDQSGVFDYYNLVIAQTIDNFTEFIFVDTFPITVNKHTYTGNDQTAKKFTPNDVFFRRPFYKTAKSITKANDYLFFSGLAEFPKYNLQPVAELIKFYWQTVAIPEEVYSDPKNTFKFRSYLRDEVYALGVVFEADNGEDVCAVHVPGPSTTYFQEEYGVNPNSIVNTKDVINDTSCDPNLRNRLWQVYNIGTVRGTAHEFTLNCDKPKCWEYGDFSYWESTEKYPNNPVIWGDLCGKPIRHHKFPDSCITHIHDGDHGAKVFEDNNIVFPIGIKIDNNSVAIALKTALDRGLITQEQKDRIKKYRVVRGNRLGNKSVIAKGLLYDVWDYTKNEKQYFYPNYPYNDLRYDSFISNDVHTYDIPDSSIADYKNQFRPSGRYTFHSPDIHFTNPRIGTELKLETEEYGQSEGYFTESLLQAKEKFLSTASYLLALAGGVAAALSTVQKECTTYTTKAPTISTQTADGHSPYGDVQQATYTLASGTGVVTPIITTSGSGTLSQGIIRDEHNNDIIVPRNPLTDLPDFPVQIETQTKTTCRGTQMQLLSPLSLSPTGFLLQQELYILALGLKEMGDIVTLIESLTPYKNFAAQYNSAGKYNNYKCIPNLVGDKRRVIDKSAYLDSNIDTINESVSTSAFNTITFNNLNRESSVYLKIKYTHPSELFPNPSVTDTSRFILSERGSYNDINQRYKSDISSYYGAIKNYIPDQYGSVYRIEYLETNACAFEIGEPDTVIIVESLAPAPGVNPLPIEVNQLPLSGCHHFVFGGDTFINRFGLKKKMPFFLDTTFKLPTGADIRYQDLTNVGYPNFYFNTGGTLAENFSSITNILTILNPGNIPTLFGVPRNRLDTNSDGTGNSTNTDGIKFFYQKGRIYLYNYGIPYFFVESDINVDYRHGQNTKERDFYPHQQNLDDWLQEKNVPITEDNYYYYNTTFSKQDHESVICVNQPNFIPGKECKVDFPYRIIYSEQSQTNSSLYDNWLVFKANDYEDFPISNGKLITADGIEDDKVLVRFENTSTIFPAYVNIQTDGDNLQVGTGGIFTSRPKNFATTDLGYCGTQHRDLLKTEFGHIWVDAKRGQIFNLASGGGGLDEISKYGMRNWFKQNLPFQIVKDFKDIPQDDLDNNFKGIGLHFSFNKRFNTFYITKLDYKLIDKKVKYDANLKKFFYRDSDNNQVFVKLTDIRYFCNKSWTVSYNFASKSWVSFHSFTPNFYIDWIDYFQSGIVGSIWSHDVSNKSFQVYYGKIQPFIIEGHSKPEIGKSFLNNVEYKLDVIRFHNQYDYFYNDLVTFNKAIIYNNKQCSGLLNLVVSNPDDFSKTGSYPRAVNNGVEIEVTNSEGLWSLNQFSDCTTTPYNNLPFFYNNCANSNKELNQEALNYYKADLDKALLRNDYFQIRLINDRWSNYKFILPYSLTRSTKSIK